MRETVICNTTPGVIHLQLTLTCDHQDCAQPARYVSLDIGSLCSEHFGEFVRGDLSVTERT